MTNFHIKFLMFSVTDIVMLYTACWIIKKYIKIFPEQLIPLFKQRQKYILYRKGLKNLKEVRKSKKIS